MPRFKKDFLHFRIITFTRFQLYLYCNNTKNIHTEKSGGREKKHFTKQNGHKGSSLAWIRGAPAACTVRISSEICGPGSWGTGMIRPHTLRPRILCPRTIRPRTIRARTLFPDVFTSLYVSSPKESQTTELRQPKDWLGI
jgi:hypothetical protein